MTKAEVRELIRQFFEGRVQEQLLQAVDELPLTNDSEIRTETGTTIGSRGFERTLDPENLTPDRVSLPTEFRISGTSAAVTSRWIKFHLLDVETDYPYRMWKRYNVFRVRRIPDGTTDEEGEFTPVQTSDSFTGHISILRQLGLIERTAREQSRAGKDRVYYRVTDPNSPYWDNPQGRLYPGSTPSTLREAVARLTEELGRSPTVEEVADELNISEQSVALRLRAWGIELPDPNEPGGGTN